MPDILLYLLVSADAAVYALLALQLRSGRGRVKGRPPGAAEAFAQLGEEIRRAVPTIPRGFTWKEAVDEARRLKVNVDWPRVDQAVRSYEGYRYGGKEPATGYEEIGRLARELRRAR